MTIPIGALIFVLFIGAAFPAPAAQLPSASSDERAVADFYRGKMPPAVKERLQRSLKR